MLEQTELARDACQAWSEQLTWAIT